MLGLNALFNISYIAAWFKSFHLHFMFKGPNLPVKYDSEISSPKFFRGSPSLQYKPEVLMYHEYTLMAMVGQCSGPHAESMRAEEGEKLIQQQMVAVHVCFTEISSRHELQG